MPYTVELPDGTLVSDIPDDMPQDEVRRRILATFPQFAPKTRTLGESVSDIGAQLKKGAGQLVQFPGQLYGLATGDFSDTGLYGYGKEMEAAAEAVKSPGLKAREAARAAAVAEAEKTGQLAAAKTAVGETITDPALALGVLAENLPSMLIPGGVAAGMGRAALRKGLAKGVEAAAAREAAIASGSKAAIRAGAVQQGADVGTGAYEEVYKRLLSQGVAEPEAASQAINLARAAGVSGAVISLLAQKLPGASKLEEVLAGKTTGKGIGRAMLSGAAGEALGEVPEEVGGKLAQNVALRAVDPTQALTAGLGETGGMAALAGAGLGGLGGGVSAMRGTPEASEAAAAARQQAQQRILAAREREYAESVSPEGYTKEGQGLLFEPTKIEEPTLRLPKDLAKLEQEFNTLAQGEQTPEAQARMALIAKRYEEVAAKQAEAPIPTPPEQLGLGLDMQRQYGDMELEKQRLLQGKQTPDVKARVKEITAQQAQMNITDIMQGRKATAQQEREAKRAAESAFAQPEVRETPEGQQLLFSQFEAPQARVEPAPSTELPTREQPPLAPSTMEKYGQRRLGLRPAKEGVTTSIAAPKVAEAPLPPVTEAVPEPKLAPKVPAMFQPVMEKLTAAGVRPETQAWAEKASNRPFLRKLMDMAPEAAPQARKALKLQEGSPKAEVFDALFPQPGVPAFEPAVRADQPRMGVPSKPRVVEAAKPPSAGVTEPVGAGVVPAERAAPAAAKPEGGAKPALEPAPKVYPALARAEQFWKDTAEAVGGETKPFTELTPAQRAAWREAVQEGDAGTLQSEYQRIVAEKPAAQPSRAAEVKEARRKAAEAEVKERRRAKEAEAAKEKERVAAQIREREQAKREAAEAKRAEQERVKAEKEAEAKAKAEAVAERERAKRETEEAPKPKKVLTREKAEELLSDLDIDPDTTKSKVKALAKRMRDAGLIDDNDVNALERISKDRDMGAEDLLDELRSSLAATEVVAKREAVKPDVLWDKFNDDPYRGRFLPFKRLTKGRQREWETAVAAGTADMDTYRQIAGAQLKAASDREAARRDAASERSVAIARRRMAESEEFYAKREAEAKRKAEEAEAKQQGLFGESDKHPEWATNHESSVGGRIVYSDEESALLRGFSVLTGQYVYAPVEPDGRYQLDVDSKLLNEKIPAERLAKLREAKARLVKEDAAKLAKYPDGPFTGVKGNVASSDGVDARYTNFLRSLMQDLGLGDIRVFMLHPENLRTSEAADKYKLYADWASARSAGLDSGEDGSIRVYGPDSKSFYISLRPGMSEQRTLETITHELGHLIQRVAYDTAPSNIQKEVRAEYEQWLVQTKGKTARELIQALRNRETAAAHMESAPETMMASEMTSYWTSFSEWFADNVSKWATTDERPVSVVEKFFKSVADKLRSLVAAVTGRDFAPAKTVASFLDKMGPANPIMWAGTTDTKAQLSRALSPTEGIAETSELMKDQPSEIKKNLRDMVRIVSEKDDVSFVTRVRTEVADSLASVVNRVNILFDGTVRDELTGLTNPELKLRQAQATEPITSAFYATGGLENDTATGQWVVSDKAGPGGSVKDIFEAIKKWGDSKGMSFAQADAEASKMIEARRLKELIQANKDAGETIFPIHKLSNKDSRSPEEQVDVALRGLAANPEVQAIADMMDKQRFYMIDHMQAVGRITKEEAAAYKEAIGYVPFDRIDDFFAKFVPKRTAGKGIAQLGSLPQFVGSTQREVGNVINNHTKLMAWMVKQTIKHDATFTTLNLLADIGQARRLGKNKYAASNAGNVVETFRNGHKEYFEMRSHWDAVAFRDAPEVKMTILKLFGAVSNILRKIVTVMPPFVAKQVTDDIQRAFIYAGVKQPSKLVIPAVMNFLKIAGHELVFGKNHPFTTEFAKKGLVGDVDYNASNPAETILFNMGYSERGWLSSLHHRLESVTRASDLAIRKAIYDRTLVETKSAEMAEGDVGLATMRAREFINFRRRGASKTVGMALATVPFFNAYIQSNDLMLRSMTGRGASGTERAVAKRLFWTQAAKMTGFALIYALASSDDDEYKKQALDDRFNNWIVGGKTLPVPGDMAALFKVPVEVLMQYMARQGTPKEQQASEAVKQMLGYAFEQFVGRANPVPQAVRPLAEAVVNYSFVTGRPLVGTYQKGLPPVLQTNTTTSELAKAFANFAYKNIRDPITDTPLELSPILIDNVVRGYLGGVVPLMNMLIDQLINPNKTDRPLSKYWLLSQYLTPEVPTGPKEEFYDLVNKVMPVKRALDNLAKTDQAAAYAYYQENKDKLKMAELVNIGLQNIKQSREYINFLESAEGAKRFPDSADRLKRKQQVEKYENDNLAWVQKAKADIFLHSKN